MSGKPVHGESYTAEYRVWQMARLRCTDPSNAAWPNYGGRGITMCPRWANSVQAFIADMGRRPSPRHEIDRIDNDKGYSPENCRWVTRTENCRNRRSNRMITMGGETRTLAEWCELRGLPRSTVDKRLRAGWAPERAMSEPIGPRGPKPRACVSSIMADVQVLEKAA
jgi:hypothetical protein